MVQGKVGGGKTVGGRREERVSGGGEEAAAGVAASRSLIPLSHCLLFFKAIIVIGGAVKGS